MDRSRSQNGVDAIKVFNDAFKTFIGALTKSLNSEIEEFRKLISQDKIEWLTPSPDSVVLNHDFGGSAVAAVRLYADPIRQVFVFEFPLSPTCSQAIPATVSEGRFVLDFSRSGATLETLSQYILTPVLFPAKISDPETIRHLKPRFGKG